jgi:outer membrane protein OmpA-like peptidoglycan-associated protein
MNSIRLRYTALPLALLLFVGMSQTGCSSFNNTGKGAVVGAGVGGAAGAVIGRATGSTARGAIIGAAVGGAAGAIIGRQMDRQAEELEEDFPEDVTVTPIPGEDGNTAGIAINFSNELLFDLGRSELRSGVRADLRDLAMSLNRYPEYDVTIVGHASTDGGTDLNQRLSDARSRAVRDFLVAQGVTGSRLESYGRGEMEPLAGIPGESPLNRRVEIAIYPSAELQRNMQDPAYQQQYQEQYDLN